MSSNVSYGRYEEAYRAIHSALSGIMAPPAGKKITRLIFIWNADGTIATLKAYEGDNEIFTLNFVWNVDGTLKEVNRSNA
ncbi:MAG: hypothetical protein QXL54_04765 [Candidatus Bathyarchaeia archaeon]